MKDSTKMFLKSMYNIAKPIAQTTGELAKCMYQGVKTGINDAYEDAKEQGLMEDLRKDTDEIRDNINRIKNYFNKED